MGKNTGGFVRNAKKLTVLGLSSFAVAAAFMSVTSATANAEVIEVAPTPGVTSRQAEMIDGNALRRTAAGKARGQGDTRSAGKGSISAQGDVRDGVIAVPGTTAAPFNLPQNGQFRVGAPMGSW